MERLAVEFDRVPETLLWTLYHRAVEARRPGAVLRDPKAVELLGQIDFPFEERFGSGEAFSQWQALRAVCFDRAVARFLERSPDGIVAALGEGLETQFWRVDNGRVRWLTVDLPEVVELRQRLLPGDPRLRAIGCSALDPAWLAEVDASSGVLVTAQGLLMYLDPGEARGLIARCAQRLRALPHVTELRALRLPRGRGLVHGALLPAAARVPALRRHLLSVLSARFA